MTKYDLTQQTRRPNLSVSDSQQLIVSGLYRYYTDITLYLKLDLRLYYPATDDGWTVRTTRFE